MRLEDHGLLHRLNSVNFPSVKNSLLSEGCSRLLNTGSILNQVSLFRRNCRAHRSSTACWSLGVSFHFQILRQILLKIQNNQGEILVVTITYFEILKFGRASLFTFHSVIQRHLLVHGSIFFVLVGQRHRMLVQARKVCSKFSLLLSPLVETSRTWSPWLIRSV